MGRSGGLVRTATCRVTRGLREDTGEAMSERVLAQRLRWLAELVAEIGQSCIDAHWDREAVQAVSAAKGPDGRALPKQGFVAFRRLWGPASMPTGTFGYSRVTNMGTELAARLLRAAAPRSTTVDTLLHGGLPEECPHPVTGRIYRRKLGRLTDLGLGLPSDLFDMEQQAPRVPALVPLAVTDAQFFTGHAGATADAAHTAVDAEVLERVAHKQQYRRARTTETERPRQQHRTRSADAVLVVRLRLPLDARPRTAARWAWHRLIISIPPKYRVGLIAPPDLRVTGAGIIRADVAVTIPAPEPRLKHGEKPSRVLAVDWGVRRLLTGAVVGALDHVDGRREATTDGHPLHFQAGRLQGKARRIGSDRHRVQGRIDRHDRLLPQRRDPELAAKRVALAHEAQRLAAKQAHIYDSVARLAARWAVEHALAQGCQAIAVEDLSNMEVRGMGKRNNERTALGLRGKTAAAIRDAAEAVGLAVLTVNARGTSTHCPRCDGRLKHRASPAGGDGRAWALCPRCGFSADRDHAAAEKIGQRALGTTHVRVRHRRRPGSPVHASHRGTAAAAPSAHHPSGPGAGRSDTSPLAPARRSRGHRSAGTSPRHEQHQAGRQRMTPLLGPPNRLNRLLRAHRTTLCATGLHQEPARSAQGGTPGGRSTSDGARYRFEPKKAAQERRTRHRPPTEPPGRGPFDVAARGFEPQKAKPADSQRAGLAGSDLPLRLRADPLGDTWGRPSPLAVLNHLPG